MRIGLTYTLKEPGGAGAGSGRAAGEGSWNDDEEEFDSPETVQAIADAIRSLGHEVTLLGDGEALLRRLLDGPRPELVFNIAEGRGVSRCREARVPAALEIFGVPCTGSDALTLAATLDKECAKRLVQSHGLPTPAWALAGEDGRALREALDRLPLPAIVKPAFEGSSKGIVAGSVVETREALLETVAGVRRRYAQPVLAEEFIDGDELTVGVIGNRRPEVLGILRVLPRRPVPRFVYSLEVKRNWREEVDYECPARLAEEDVAAVNRAALGVYKALGCRDLARIDFRLRDHVPYFLEVNPLPGLSPESGDLVILARSVGIGHRELIGRILAAACERLQ
jgi:D-alanine-D-alanine ligase